MGELRSPRVAAVSIPKELVVSKRPAVHGQTGRSTSCFQKQSLPYIRRVQHTALSVDGLKGNIREFELSVLRSRMLEAARAKARRGELRIGVPVGYVWHRELGLDFDPDQRLQQVIRLIFTRFRELGSARQAFLVLRADGIHFPRPSEGGTLASFDWTPIRYRNVISVLKNPFYAGAYAYGKSEKRTVVEEGRAQELWP